MATQSGIKERTRDRLKEPGQYAVVMHNDDFTTMEFVVEVLVRIFHKDRAKAEALMLQVHHEGRAAVGVYPLDIAVSRVNKALQWAKEKGFPFRMTVEEV